MIAPPTFRSIPAFVVGIPVFWVKFLFNLVIPNALFKEKLKPGILVLVIIIICFKINTITRSILLEFTSIYHYS